MVHSSLISYHDVSEEDDNEEDDIVEDDIEEDDIEEDDIEEDDNEENVISHTMSLKRYRANQTMSLKRYGANQTKLKKCFCMLCGAECHSLTHSPGSYWMRKSYKMQ